MEPRTGCAPVSAVYETAESLSILTGHSITGSPIIVKYKSVPAPFVLLGSPQQDRGSGSLPPRNLIIWSGWWDLNPQSPVSETGRVTRFSYTLVKDFILRARVPSNSSSTSPHVDCTSLLKTVCVPSGNSARYFPPSHFGR